MLETTHLQATLQKIQRLADDEKIVLDKQPQTTPLSELDHLNKNTSFVMAFSPISSEQLFEWAIDNLLLPPKTTYMEPKMLTGLFLQML